MGLHGREKRELIRNVLFGWTHRLSPGHKICGDIDYYLE